MACLEATEGLVRQYVLAELVCLIVFEHLVAVGMTIYSKSPQDHDGTRNVYAYSHETNSNEYTPN